MKNIFYVILTISILIITISIIYSLVIPRLCEVRMKPRLNAWLDQQCPSSSNVNPFYSVVYCRSAAMSSPAARQFDCSK